MDIKYTDQQIAELINERKVLPDDWRTQLDKNNSLHIIRELGNRFRLIINLNEKYSSDFSVILAVIIQAILKDSNYHLDLFTDTEGRALREKIFTQTVR